MCFAPVLSTSAAMSSLAQVELRGLRDQQVGKLSLTQPQGAARLGDGGWVLDRELNIVEQGSCKPT